MRMLFALVVGAAMILGGPAAWARGGGGHGGGHGHSGGSRHGGHGMFGDGGSAQDEREFLAGAEKKFRRANPCPSTGSAYGSCPGYVIDYIQPLKEGGADVETNMRWRAEAGS